MWFYGVNPGALAAGAASYEAANLEMRKTLTLTFIDQASNAASFDEFKHAVEAYFHETDGDSEAEWLTARDCIRSGRIPAPAGDAARNRRAGAVHQCA